MPKQTLNRCPKCHRTVARPIRGGACSRCRSKRKRTDPFAGLRLVRAARRPPRPRPLRIANRSNSAPPPSLCTQLGTYTPNGVTYVDDLTDGAWTGAVGQVRLAYRDLTGPNQGMEGLVMRPPNTTQKLRNHFDAIENFMRTNRKRSDATEGTGEAAAALGVLHHYPGYEMVWGFGRHAGAGVDQIWKKQTGGVTTDYLIVEAKGVGQRLSNAWFQPPKVGQQMSLEWIVDRLARMSNPIGNKVLTRCGLKVYTQWPHYQGGSKSYYGARATGTRTVNLYGVVIAAVWQAGPRLGFQLSHQVKYL